MEPPADVRGLQEFDEVLMTCNWVAAKEFSLSYQIGGNHIACFI